MRVYIYMYICLYTHSSCIYAYIHAHFNLDTLVRRSDGDGASASLLTGAGDLACSYRKGPQYLPSHC